MEDLAAAAEPSMGQAAAADIPVVGVALMEAHTEQVVAVALMAAATRATNPEQEQDMGGW